MKDFHNRKATQFSTRFMEPPPGGAWNPLLKYPVNKPCWCGAKKEVEEKSPFSDGSVRKVIKPVKAKNCCQPYASRCLSVELATEIKQKWNLLLTGQWTLPKAPRENNEP